MAQRRSGNAGQPNKDWLLLEHKGTGEYALVRRDDLQRGVVPGILAPGVTLSAINRHPQYVSHALAERGLIENNHLQQVYLGLPVEQADSQFGSIEVKDRGRYREIQDHETDTVLRVNQPFSEYIITDPHARREYGHGALQPEDYAALERANQNQQAQEARRPLRQADTFLGSNPGNMEPTSTSEELLQVVPEQQDYNPLPPDEMQQNYLIPPIQDEYLLPPSHGTQQDSLIPPSEGLEHDLIGPDEREEKEDALRDLGFF